MPKVINLFVVTLVVFLFSFNVTLAVIEKPQLRVDFGPVPLQFDKVECPPGGVCEIPWIGVYIGAIYRYGIGLAAILAVVAIMIAGFMWLSSAGSPDKVKTAQSIIGSSVAGLALALFSFIILQTVNPKLVNLEPLKIKSIKSTPLQSASGAVTTFVCKTMCGGEGNVKSMVVADHLGNVYCECKEGTQTCPSPYFSKEKIPSNQSCADYCHSFKCSGLDAITYPKCCKCYKIREANMGIFDPLQPACPTSVN